MTRRIFVAAFVCVAIAAHADQSVAASGPVGTSKSFIQAVADRDITACRYLGPDAIDLLKAATQASSCAKAIRARILPERAFLVKDRAALARHLASGQLLRNETGIRFEWKTGRRSRATLYLNRVSDHWRVTAFLASRVVTCEVHEPCSPPPSRRIGAR
jgi:hypothetical protein